MSEKRVGMADKMSVKPIRVLLVDDDEDILVLVSAYLEESGPATYILDRVATYEAGIEAIGRDEHDVCLLDYRLGARSGVDFLREVMANDCATPIIMLTGQGDAEVDEEAMNIGAVTARASSRR